MGNSKSYPFILGVPLAVRGTARSPKLIFQTFIFSVSELITRRTIRGKVLGSHLGSSDFSKDD